MISIQQIQDEYQQDIANAVSIDEIQHKYLSRKGYIAQLFAQIQDIPADQKKEYGQNINLFKQKIEEYIVTVQPSQISALSLHPIHPENIDQSLGHISPISWLIFRIQDIFAELGFSVATGPELEDEYHNFDALNIPADHPARDVWDTMWVSSEEGLKGLLRTHTSPVQIRYMQQYPQAPIRIIAPGKVYRYEATDATHETVFHQIEGLMLDTTTSIATFKGIIQKFFGLLFQQDIKIRLRPSYFPFTEPSFEIDIWKDDHWIEIAGAGMVHRIVLQNGGITDPAIQGFAFGFGVERLAMILYEIDDVRLIHSGDIRFASQLGITKL